MDSLLLVGVKDDNLKSFLTRMGYALVEETEKNKFKDIVQEQFIDLILVDGSTESDPVSVCEVLRKGEFSRDLPIMLLSPHRVVPLQLREQGIDRIETIEIPYSAGTVVTRIATQLRLRKMSGARDRTATLSEANAALRDLNQRFQKEVEEARAIQSALLPDSLPKGDGFDVAVSYKPLEEVGGDWYFVRREASGRLSLFIADVTGHGLSAAFLGSMTKLALFAAEEEDPGKRLHRMNALMAPHLPQGRFVTAMSFLFDTTSGELSYARAGAPPALQVGGSGNAVELKGEGFPLGFFDDSEYQTLTTTLARGEILAIVTDGVTEAQNRKKEVYGMAHITRAIASCSVDASAESVITAMLNDFSKFLDGRILKDDVTVMVLKRV